MKLILPAIFVALTVWTIFDPVTPQQRREWCGRIEFKSFACDRYR